jgi:hypothetical protein
VILARAIDDRQLGDELIAAVTKAFGGLTDGHSPSS